MEPIKTPDRAMRYILLQRTQYLNNNFLFKFLTYLGYINFFNKSSINTKTLLFPSQIKREFNKDMDSEILILKPYLPKKADSILDIGCGVAGIDVLISKHYQNKMGIFLIDKTLIDKKLYYKFHKKASFYNSLEVSRELLEINGVNPKMIHLQEATEDNKILFNQKFDLIISLISWGFHYPVSTYLDEVYKKLKPNGKLILDIRKNTNGEKEIEKKFGNYKIIFESDRYIRVLTQKKD